MNWLPQFTKEKCNMKRKRLFVTRLSAMLTLFGVGGALCPADTKTIQVQCGVPGRSIGLALEQAQPGDVISIQGTCEEKVTITTEHITLDGLGTGAIRGAGLAGEVFNPLIAVDGAQGVIIRGLRVENGPGEAILVENGSAVSLTNLTLSGNTVGLALAAGATAELADSTIENNLTGVGLLTGSSLVLKGRVIVSNNQDIGFDITGNSTVEIRGALVEVNNNARHGMTLDGSRLVLLGIPQSQGSSLTLNGNGANGILLGQSSLSFFGAPAANRITISNNRGIGIRTLLGARILSPQAAVVFQIEGNATGIAFESDSGALIVGGLSVLNNGTGALADGSGVVMLISPPGAPSSITGNVTQDFDARFGSRIRLIGVSVGPKVVCEPTVLSQGLACP
jgi:nitrous oxidase accessory protein NosD